MAVILWAIADPLVGAVDGHFPQLVGVGAVESMRSILHFGGDTEGDHLLTFAIWGAVSLACVFVVDTLRPL